MTNFYSPTWLTPPNGGAAYRLHLVVNVVGQNLVANTSTLEYQLWLAKDRSFPGFNEYASHTVVVVNGTVDDFTTPVPDHEWLGWSEFPLTGTGRVTVTHDTDGTKTIPVGATYEGANTGWAIGTLTFSDTMTLPPIARATTPVISPSPATVGADVTIDLSSRASASYTHTVTWTCGTQFGTIATDSTATSLTWTLPDVMSEYALKKVPIVVAVVTKLSGVVIGAKQVTIFEQATPTAPSTEAPDPSKQLDIRAKLVTYESDEWSAKRELSPATLKMVDPASATTTVEIALSKLLDPDFDDYSVIDVDTFDGDDWTFTDHRFVLSRLEGNTADATQTITYSGTEFVDFELGFAYTQKEYDWASATPGEIVKTLILDAKARGWGPRMDCSATALLTSLGDSWANVTPRKISKGTPISQVLEGLVTDGLVEYRTEYHDNKAWLVLLNPGTGSNYATLGANPVVNLSLVSLTSAPRRASIEKRLTRVTVEGNDTIQVTRETASIDANVFGQMEGWVSASGATTATAAGTIADNALRDNGSATNERTFEYDAKDVPGQFYPYSIFTPGDWLIIPDGDNTATDRISQITISKTVDGDKTITVLTGDRILGGTASLAKRQSAQNGGSIAGGNQTTLSPLDSRIPSSPVIGAVTSVGYWDSDGAAKSAVTISFAAVTEALNGAAITCDLYEVYWRTLGGQWALKTSTDQLSIEIPGWDVLQSIELRVRGRSVAGTFGQFSANQSHTTAAPAVDLDGPIIADLYTDGVGSIYIVWAGVLGTDPAPARLAYVVAEVSIDGGSTYVTTGTPISGPGTLVLNIGVWGDYLVRLRGYDRLGNAGDASDPESITLTDPHIDPPTPNAPTGLTATAGAGWDASGFLPEAWFDLAWTAPTEDTLGNPIDIVGYDVWGKRSSETALRYLTSSSLAEVRVRVIDGEQWSFQVLASSNFGGVSPLSDPVTEIADATIDAPDAPTAPVLSQYAGMLRIQWAGGGMVPQVKYAYATISTSSGGTFTRVGMPLTGSGEVVVPGLAPGAEYFAKIVLVDERDQHVASAESAGLVLNPITGITVQTSPIANTGIKMTTSSLTAYDVSGNPTFILDAGTGQIWIAPYDAVFHFGANGTEAESGDPTVGLAISGEDSSFNTFFHPAGMQIRNDQEPLSWWEADENDASLVNFFSPRAVVGQRMRVGDYEFLKEEKSTGTRLVIRYKGA